MGRRNVRFPALEPKEQLTSAAGTAEKNERTAVPIPENFHSFAQASAPSSKISIAAAAWNKGRRVGRYAVQENGVTSTEFAAKESID